MCVYLLRAAAPRAGMVIPTDTCQQFEADLNPREEATKKEKKIILSDFSPLLLSDSFGKVFKETQPENFQETVSSFRKSTTTTTTVMSDVVRSLSEHGTFLQDVLSQTQLTLCWLDLCWPLMPHFLSFQHFSPEAPNVLVEKYNDFRKKTCYHPLGQFKIMKLIK